jgi:hypothetical protein
MPGSCGSFVKPVGLVGHVGLVGLGFRATSLSNCRYDLNAEEVLDVSVSPN